MNSEHHHVMALIGFGGFLFFTAFVAVIYYLTKDID